MKNLILGIALVGCTFACKTEKNAAITDPSSANVPTAGCCDKSKGECTDAQKAECSSKKVCPVTGKAEG